MQAGDHKKTVKISVVGAHDLPLIHALQCRAYGSEFHEPIELYEDMLAFYPDGCFALWVQDTMAGFLFIHPADDDRTDYETAGWDIRGDEQCVYIHDLCIDPQFQGQGLTRQAVEHMEAFAKQRGFQKIIGIAIKGVEQFWEKQGFVMGRSYRYSGQDATFMEKTIG